MTCIHINSFHPHFSYFSFYDCSCWALYRLFLAMLSSPTRNDSLNFAQVTDYISSFSQRFLGTRACHLYLMDFFPIFWNRLELLCPLLPTATNLLLNFPTFWISLVLHYFLTYTLPLLYLSFPVSCDVLLSISGAGALAEAGWQIHCWFERSRSQTIRPSHRHTALSLTAVCIGRSYHHPYLIGGETQCPEGKVASCSHPGRLRAWSGPPSFHSTAHSRRWGCLGNESQSRNKKSQVGITCFCIKKYAVNKDTPECLSGPESIWLKFDSKRNVGFLKRIF